MAEIPSGQIQLDFGACFQAVWRRCWGCVLPWHCTTHPTDLTHLFLLLLPLPSSPEPQPRAIVEPSPCPALPPNSTQQSCPWHPLVQVQHCCWSGSKAGDPQLCPAASPQEEVQGDGWLQEGHPLPGGGRSSPALLKLRTKPSSG